MTENKKEIFPSDFGKKPLAAQEEESIRASIVRHISDPALKDSDDEHEFFPPKPRRDPPFDAW